MSLEQASGCWPNQSQKQLLDVLLKPDAIAIKAWASWIQSVDILNLDQGSDRLLPFLYQRLSTLEVVHPVMDRLKGIHRHAYYKNRMLFHQATGLFQKLQQQNIDIVLIKGAALASYYYPAIGLRPMSDLDILIASQDIEKVIHSLVDEQGWKMSFPFGVPQDESQDQSPRIKVHHAISFIKDIEVDLHQHLLPEGVFYPEITVQTKAHAVNVDFYGLTVQQLSATDHLYHTLIHGLRWNSVSSLRWIIDAAYIFKTSSADIDWHRLLTIAKQTKTTEILKHGLYFLAEEYQLPVPDKVLAQVHAEKTSWLEKYEYKVRIRQPSSLIPQVYHSAIQFMLHSPHRGLGNITGYLQFATQQQGVAGIPQLFTLFFKVLIKKRRTLS